MRLGINAITLHPGKVGGAEQYIRNIVAKLGEYEDITTYLFLNEGALSTFEESEKLRLVKIDMGYDHSIQLNGFIALYHIDVWFCPMFHLVPHNCSIPNVTSIFDIQQDYFPENFDAFVLSERKRLTEQTVRSTDLILTISDFSKQTLLEKYDLSPERIKVSYLDADASFSLPIDPEKLETIRQKLPKEFILFPANMWPHKNHAALIKGFALAREKYHLPLQLVFTGAQERETAQIEELIREHHLRDHITYLGYIPQDDMRYVFRCASMLAFPSFFEGFGIPLVEAMASDLPILCSTASCVPEVAGDAALLFDPHSPEEICEAIYRIYSDADLRSDLIARGRKRRQMFSWDQCALETVQHLRSMYKPRKALAPRLSKHPKVTIVTPSYNQGQYIRDTIESVLNQTYDNIEYIVMDGGSTDETVEILKSYGDRIKWVSEKDGGQADAVNKGIRIAQGEIIGWLNSDDTYYPQAVEIAVSTLLEHPDVDMVYGEGNYIDRKGNVTTRYTTKMYDYGLLASECFICQPTAFFTREIVTKVGLLNADLHLCMDYELWMRIGKAGKVLYVPDYLATSRMYEENKTMSRRSEVYKECCREVKRYYGFVPHPWILGYSIYSASLHPWIKMHFYYMWLFFRYNYDAPGYFKPFMRQLLAKCKSRLRQMLSYRKAWLRQGISRRIRRLLGRPVPTASPSPVSAPENSEPQTPAAEERKPLVSIITPSYNQGEFIRATIESVLSQDYPHIEYIIIDGGSTDNTLDIVREYKDRLTYISERDNGQSDAINKGFRMAKGEIVAWLNSDDVYEPGCISKAVRAFNANPNAALVYGNGNLIHRDGSLKRQFEWCRDFNLWSLVHIWDYIMQPATFFRADALRDVGYLREDLHWAMDWDLWLKLSLKHDVVFLPDILACSREYEDTKTSTGGDKRLQELLHLMQEYTDQEHPYGYEIYQCSETLASHDLTPQRRDEVTKQLMKLLFLQPTPDPEGRCTTEVNFLLRPHQSGTAIEIENLGRRSVPMNFDHNGELFLSCIVKPGKTRIALPQVDTAAKTHIHVTIHSKKLQKIKHQNESWIRMHLIP